MCLKIRLSNLRTYLIMLKNKEDAWTSKSLDAKRCQISSTEMPKEAELEDTVVNKMEDMELEEVMVAETEVAAANLMEQEQVLAEEVQVPEEEELAVIKKHPCL